MQNMDNILNIGDSILLKDAWNFKGIVSQKFDEHIKKSVPFYEEGHELILKLASFFLRDQAVCYDLGTSTGGLITKLAVKFPSCDFYGIDLEKDMSAIAKERASAFKNVEIITGDVAEQEFKKSDLFIAYYTIQFIKPEKRAKLLQNIYESLNKGGAFIWFEKTVFGSALIQEINHELLTEFKLSKGFSYEEILAKNKSLQGVLQPFTTKENLALLKSSGFKTSDVIFKYNFFEGYLAVK